MTTHSGGLLADPPLGSALPAPPRSDDFRAAMGGFPTGVAVLTQGSDGDLEAVTVNSLTSVSLDPLLLVVCVRNGGRITGRLSAAGSFAVNVLAEHQQWIATRFSRTQRPSGRPAMRRLGAVAGVTGNAVLPSAVAHFECRLTAEYPGGDHMMFLGEVVALHGSGSDRRPLLFHRGRYAALGGVPHTP